MKRALIFIVVLLIAAPVFAQVETYGMAGAGVLMQKGGHSAFAAFAGTNTPVIKISEKGFLTYNRTQVLYSDGLGDQEIQALSTYLINQKSLGFLGMYASLGSGLIYEIREGDDIQDLALKAEMGAVILWQIGLAGGIDYIPVAGGPDSYYIYGMLNLTP